MFYTLYEPIRGVKLLHQVNQILTNSPERVVSGIGILADIFVFTYPVFLVYRFLHGYFKNKNKSDYYSVKIGINTGIVAAFNIIIQFIGFKERPIFSQGESLPTILKELPTASFPSDHAAVSMMIGLSAVYYGKNSNNKTMENVGYFWVITSFIMGVCRIATGVHWPTDIIAGRTGAYIIFELVKENDYSNQISKWAIRVRSNLIKRTKNILTQNQSS